MSSNGLRAAIAIGARPGQAMMAASCRGVRQANVWHAAARRSLLIAHGVRWREGPRAASRPILDRCNAFSCRSSKRSSRPEATFRRLDAPSTEAPGALRFRPARENAANEPKRGQRNSHINVGEIRPFNVLINLSTREASDRLVDSRAGVGNQANAIRWAT